MATKNDSDGLEPVGHHLRADMATKNDSDRLEPVGHHLRAGYPAGIGGNFVILHRDLSGHGFEVEHADIPDLIRILTANTGLVLVARHEAEDAKRYRRLRILGAAPGGSPQLNQGTVLVSTNLDHFVDEDLRNLRNYPSRGEARGPATGDLLSGMVAVGSPAESPSVAAGRAGASIDDVLPATARQIKAQYQHLCNRLNELDEKFKALQRARNTDGPDILERVTDLESDVRGPGGIAKRVADLEHGAIGSSATASDMAQALTALAASVETMTPAFQKIATATAGDAPPTHEWVKSYVDKATHRLSTALREFVTNSLTKAIRDAEPPPGVFQRAWRAVLRAAVTAHEEVKPPSNTAIGRNAKINHPSDSNPVEGASEFLRMAVKGIGYGG